MRTWLRYLGLLAGLLLSTGTLRAQPEWLEDAQGCQHERVGPDVRERTTWTGACVNGFAAGPGEQKWWLNERLRASYTGTKQGGRLEGEGTLVTVGGLRYEGRFAHGMREGRGRMQWPDGSVYEGEFSANQLHGLGVMVFDNGHRYAGRFEHGLLLGEAQVNWPRGQDVRRLEQRLFDGADQLDDAARPGPVRQPPVSQMGPSCTPRYPQAALQAEATGTTGVSMLIDEGGKVTKVRITETSGDTPAHKLLDLVTATSIWNCRFSPGTLDGKSSPMWARIQYVWRIE